MYKKTTKRTINKDYGDSLLSQSCCPIVQSLLSSVDIQQHLGQWQGISGLLFVSASMTLHILYVKDPNRYSIFCCHFLFSAETILQMQRELRGSAARHTYLTSFSLQAVTRG